MITELLTYAVPIVFIVAIILYPLFNTQHDKITQNTMATTVKKGKVMTDFDFIYLIFLAFVFVISVLGGEPFNLIVIVMGAYISIKIASQYKKFR